MKSLATLLPPESLFESKVPLETPVSGITQSTESLEPGNLYFAVRGSQHDGHAFAAQAIAAGAAAAVVESREVYSSCPKAIFVDSTRRALGRCASRWYDKPSENLKLVGVTGTNGKTTSTFLLNEVWRRQGLQTGLLGTVQYVLGDQILPAPLTTPDALTFQRLLKQMVDRGVTHSAVEVSSIALDQHRVTGSRFEVALFTNLTQDHLDYHGTMQAYEAAKQKLFTHFDLGAAVINVDDPAGQRLADLNPPSLLTFSTRNPRAHFNVADAVISEDGIRAKLRTPEGECELLSPLIGAHNLSNCLGVLAVEHALGHDLSAVLSGLQTCMGAPGRLEKVGGNPKGAYVFVDYAHTEDALKNVLESLRRVRGSGRIITVFGCGGDRDRSKRPKMAEIASTLSDLVVATSDNPRTEDPEAIIDEIEKGICSSAKYYRQSDRRKAIHQALDLANRGDFILVAGKGHENYQILGTQKVPFDDREVIRDYYDV